MEVKDDTGKILQKKDQNALLRCIRMEEEMVENEIQTLMKMGVIKSAPIEISHKLGELKSRWLEMLGLKPISTSLVSTTTKETSGATSLN